MTLLGDYFSLFVQESTATGLVSAETHSVDCSHLKTYCLNEISAIAESTAKILDCPRYFRQSSASSGCLLESDWVTLILC